MTIVFKNPPLVELIAELRWGMPTIGIVPGAAGPLAFQPPVGADGNPLQFQLSFVTGYDPFFMRFGVEAHRLGYTIQERIVPPNSFFAPFQTVWRWKKPNSSGLYLQLGAGVFTVNGGPPDYSHWDQFVPTVKEGVAGLLAALEAYPGARPASFSQTLLRYIDLFDSDSAKATPPLAFLSDVMGLKLGVPDVISGLTKAGGQITPNVSLNVPIEDGTVQLMFASGVVAGRAGHIFDSTVYRNVEVPLDPEAVAENFSGSHKITNEIFMALTKPLHESMEPLK